MRCWNSWALLTTGRLVFFNVFLAFSSLRLYVIEVLSFWECQLNCDFVNSSGIWKRFPCSLEFSVIHVTESVDTGLWFVLVSFSHSLDWKQPTCLFISVGPFVFARNLHVTVCTGAARARASEWRNLFVTSYVINHPCARSTCVFFPVLCKTTWSLRFDDNASLQWQLSVAVSTF